MKTKLAITLLVLCFTLPAWGLTINLDYLGGSVTTEVVGTGTLQGVMRAAADMWQAVIPDTWTLNLEYGYQPILAGALHQTLAEVDGRETSGRVLFNTTFFNKLFIDSTPFDNSEYNTFNTYTNA